MLVKDFDFNLPSELIAQSPLRERSESRLMVVKPQSGKLLDDRFINLGEYLRPGDVLVRNNTRVLPARLLGVKVTTGAVVEVLLLKQINEDYWECLVGNARVVKVGTVVNFNEGELQAECIEVREEGIRVFRMKYQGVFLELLERLGKIPLPPYIHEKLNDAERYQTVYAKKPGSAAAPTAGLHFTEELFTRLEAQGVEVLDLTLEIGLGTFRPIKVEEVTEHHMHEETYEISEEVAAKLNEAKKEKKRIIAIGTTSCRTLEANFGKYRSYRAESSSTDIFIYPGYRFRAIDCLITNFHLPKSTLIMLVAAFAGQELTMKAYSQAIEKGYRFFSFGDSMFIDYE